MTIDVDRAAELTLALMYMTSWEEHGDACCWKGYDWDLLARLHEKGWISNPRTKAKSVAFTEEGRQRALEVFTREFGAEATEGSATTASLSGGCRCGCGKPTGGAPFLPGHDQTLRTSLESKVGGIIAMQTLVQAVEEYASGRGDLEALGAVVRRLYWRRERT